MMPGHRSGGPVLPGSANAHDHLVKAISDWLTLHKVPHFRINQRPVKTAKGWRNPGADTGAPDIIAVLSDGRAWCIEAKTGKAGERPEQRAARVRWEERRARWGVVRSVDQLSLVAQ